MMKVYLHLGGDVSVYSEDIIGIFDYKLINSNSFREFIKFSQWSKSVQRIEGSPKTIVLTENIIFFVPVSRATLVRRAEKTTFQLKG